MLEDVLREYGGTEVSSMDVYTDMFRLGDGVIQSSGDNRDRKPNPIGYWKNRDQRGGHFRVMLEDTFEQSLKEMQDADFSLMNGITYYGRRRVQERSSSMYAMIFDLDGVTDSSLRSFVNAAMMKEYDIYPLPNYIILSGTGVHLYYIFEEPISLYPYMKTQLKELKYALTTKMWNRYTSTEKSIQYQGIYQAFRVIGGATKVPGVKVRAFRMNAHPYTLEQLGRYIPEQYRVDETKLYKESKMSLEDAAKKYPEWYRTVVLGGGKSEGHWICKRDLYEWWIRKIKEGASYGHRYYDIMCLVIYAIKSGVSLEEVKKDAYSLVPFLNSISPDNPFTRSDVKSALECYGKEYYRFPIDDIIKKSGIEIQKNKRNGRKLSAHIKLVNAQRKFLRDEIGEDAYKNNGRPSAEPIVLEWQKNHPGGRRADCIRDTGLTKPTVYKHWRTAEEISALTSVTIDRDARSWEEQDRMLREYYEGLNKSIDQAAVEE